MKRIVLLSVFVAAVVFATGAVSAQRIVSLGVKGGITTQHAKFYGDKEFTPSGTTGVGGHAALFGRVSLLGIHVQPELMYSYTSYKLGGRVTLDDMVFRTDGTVRMHSLDFPVAVGLKFLWFRFQAGPQFNLLSEARIAKSTTIKDIKITVPHVSYIAGVGFDLMKFSLDVRYHGYFGRATQAVVHKDLGFSAENKVQLSNWMVSLGYRF